MPRTVTPECAGLPKLAGISELVKVTGLKKACVADRMSRADAPPGRQVSSGPVWVLADAVAYLTTGEPVARPVRLPELAGVGDLARASGRTVQDVSVILQRPDGPEVHRLAMGPVVIAAVGIPYAQARRRPGPVAGPVPNHAGLRYYWRARSTGTHVGVYNAEEAGMDTGGGPWSTVCEKHGGIRSHLTLKLAQRSAPHPEEWCEVCMGNTPAD